MPHKCVSAVSGKVERPRTDDIAHLSFLRPSTIDVGHDLVPETNPENRFTVISTEFEECTQRPHPFGVIINTAFRTADDDTIEIVKIGKWSTIDDPSHLELGLWQMRNDPLLYLLRGSRHPFEQGQRVAGQFKKRDPHQSKALSIPAIFTPVNADASKLRARRSSVSRL